MTRSGNISISIEGQEYYADIDSGVNNDYEVYTFVFLLIYLLLLLIYFILERKEAFDRNVIKYFIKR